jgi:hypothetical protein
MKKIAASLAMTMASTVFGHENHGLEGSHWHASDAWGSVVLAAALALLLASRK